MLCGRDCRWGAGGSTWGWTAPSTPQNHSLPLIPPPHPEPISQGIRNFRNSQFSWKRRRNSGSETGQRPCPSPETEDLFHGPGWDREGKLVLKPVQNFYYLGLDHFNYRIATVFVVYIKRPEIILLPKNQEKTMGLAWDREFVLRQGRNGPHWINFKGQTGAKIKLYFSRIHGSCLPNVQIPCLLMEPRKEIQQDCGHKRGPERQAIPAPNPCQRIWPDPRICRAPGKRLPQ